MNFAWSVSWYPYYRSQILQDDKYTKWINIAKRNCNKNVWIKLFGQKMKTQQQQNKKANIKILARAGIWTLDLSHRSLTHQAFTFSLKCYLSATSSSQHIDWSPAIELFQCNGSKHNQTKPDFWATLFQQLNVDFSVIF